MLSRKSAWLNAGLFLCTQGCAGFQEMKQTLADLQDLQRRLVQELHEPNTNVNVSDKTLVVTFVNSELASLPPEDRASTARHVAELVRDHYAAYPTLTNVSVGFVTSASVGIASASRTEIPYSFQTSDLGPGPRSTNPLVADTGGHRQR
jgi:hypothetical protein